MVKLTPKQTEYFRSMESLFDSSGWSVLQQGWKQEQEALPDRVFFGAKDMTLVIEARIRYELLTELLGLPAQIESQKQQILDADEEPSDEDPSSV